VVADGARLDFETAPVQHVIVRVSDAGGLSMDLAVTVTLTNVDDTSTPPTVPPTPPTPTLPPVPGTDPGGGLPPPSPPLPPVTSPVTPPAPATKVEPARPATPTAPQANVPAELRPGHSQGEALVDPRGERNLAESIAKLVRSSDRGGSPTPFATVSFAPGPFGTAAFDFVSAALLPHEATRDLLAGLRRDAALHAEATPHESALERVEHTFAAAVRDPVRVASATVTAGFVWWLTRSGGLLTTMLLGVPAWRHVDLLPVLAADREDDEDDGDAADRDGADSALDPLFERSAGSAFESTLLP